MLWKVARGDELPDWARLADHKDDELYIYPKYPWNDVMTRPFTLWNLIKTILDIRRYHY